MKLEIKTLKTYFGVFKNSTPKRRKGFANFIWELHLYTNISKFPGDGKLLVFIKVGRSLEVNFPFVEYDVGRKRAEFDDLLSGLG